MHVCVCAHAPFPNKIYKDTHCTDTREQNHHAITRAHFLIHSVKITWIINDDRFFQGLHSTLGVQKQQEDNTPVPVHHLDNTDLKLKLKRNQ